MHSSEYEADPPAYEVLYYPAASSASANCSSASSRTCVAGPQSTVGDRSEENNLLRSNRAPVPAASIPLLWSERFPP